MAGAPLAQSDHRQPGPELRQCTRQPSVRGLCQRHASEDRQDGTLHLPS
jgi:hypothetical protein